jgi:hypothetical protein
MNILGHCSSGMISGEPNGGRNSARQSTPGKWQNLASGFCSLGAALAFSGCVASIGPVTVAPGEPGERPEVNAAVKSNSTSIRSVTLQTGQPGGPFTDVGPMTESAGKFRGKLNPVTAGTFEAKVLVKYVPVFQSAQQTVAAGKEFTIAPFPPGTFDFGTGGLSGWTFQGVFNVANTFVACPPVELSASPKFSRGAEGWPGNANNGSLRVLVSAPCYPDSRTETTGEFWRINLASPLLTSNPAWQGARGVSFRMISRLPVKVSAFVVVEGANGQDQLVFPVAAGRSDLTDIVPGNGLLWTIVTKTGYIPERPIKQVLISIFGRPEDVQSLGEPAIIQLDVVSPVP